MGKTKTTARARTTTLIAAAYGYFAWNLQDGGVRILLSGCAGVDVPKGHPMHAKIAAATRDTIESLFDAAYSGVDAG